MSLRRRGASSDLASIERRSQGYSQGSKILGVSGVAHHFSLVSAFKNLFLFAILLFKFYDKNTLDFYLSILSPIYFPTIIKIKKNNKQIRIF